MNRSRKQSRKLAAKSQLRGVVVPDPKASGVWVWDFMTGSMPPGALLTRGTPGVRINASGTLVSEGADCARFGYSSANELEGLLAEPATRNLFGQSGTFAGTATSFVPARASLAANASIAPDGTSTAVKLVEDCGPSTTHRLLGDTLDAVSSSTTYTLSIFAKAAERFWLGLRLFAPPFGTSAQSAYFNLSSGEIGTVGDDLTGMMKPVGRGWYICSVSRGASSDTPASVSFDIATADGTIVYDGDGSSGLYLWGAQIEPNEFSTSYTATTNTGTTRAADVLSLALPTGVYNVDIVRVTGTTKVTRVAVNGNYTVPTGPAPLQKIVATRT